MEKAKHHKGNRRRRDRAARMQKRSQQRCAMELSENEDESLLTRQKRPPTRKKRNKDPIFQEDIIDGFAFLCFKSYEDIERLMSKCEKKEEGSIEEGGPPTLEESLPHLDKKPKVRRNNTLPKVKKKKHLSNNKIRNKDSSMIDENSRPGDEIFENHRSVSRDQLSDGSSRASLERGYMCDSESGDERGSDPECDLFNSKVTDSNFIAKKNNPGHSQSCLSPPLLPPIHPVQNGTLHAEPSTAAVAAVSASASPAHTPSNMVVGATSPREPQIGSPAVIPVSPPPMVSFLQKDRASGSKTLANGYEFVSDPSPPSPPTGKMLSPGKYLHKRAGVPPSSSNKPTINVYDFVSDHSAPSSPDQVIFVSQSKYHHKGQQQQVSPSPHLQQQQPPHPGSMQKESPPEKSLNGHAANLCAVSSSPPVLSSSVVHNKSALDMSLKTNIKQEPVSLSSSSLPLSSSSNNNPYGSVIVKTEQTLPPLEHLQQRLQVSSASSYHPYSTTSSHQQHIRKVSPPRMSPLQHSASPAAGRGMPSTPVPPPRDTHSSHSNSSLSSLSQLSQKEGRSHSNSSNSAAAAGSSLFTSAGSLAGAMFSKPQQYGSSNSSNATSTTPVTTRPSSPVQQMRGSPATHHSSPFGGPPPPPLLPVSSQLFAPLQETTSPAAAQYGRDALFPPPQHEYKKHPDFLRRELDTRFLASQDHSIPIPPPPYMQNEHQMHQQGASASFMAPPSLGAPMTQGPSHLYEKYPKLESSLYRRPSVIGISNYPPVSSLFGGGASTPFVPPAHLSAIQPKITTAPKLKSLKPGKWCAMHVRIAWEIYNHQQKQKAAEAHKALTATAARPPDHHLFCSTLPRSHELSPFSTSLLSAATSAHPRSFESPSHHSTFLNPPTPAHLGPFSRQGYPTFAGAGPPFSSLGPLGMPGPSMLGADLRLGGSGDPWVQRLPFPGASPWGGLKEEVERQREEERKKRMEQERREKEERERREQERREQERKEQERRELERQEQERKEKERREQERRREMERREMERREQERREIERREQERQKERDRELRLHHQLQKSALVMNGDLREHHHLHHLAPPQHHPSVIQEWERNVLPPGALKYEDGRMPYPIKIKQERKDDEPLVTQRRKELPSPAKDMWGPLTPSPTVLDQYRPSPRERYDATALALTARDSSMEAYERAAAKHQLLPPPLRANESPYGTPPTLPPASASSFFSPPVSPFLGRTKLHNGLPPPLIPCTFPGNPFQRTSSPMGPYFVPKERNGQPEYDAHLRL